VRRRRRRKKIRKQGRFTGGYNNTHPMVLLSLGVLLLLAGTSPVFSEAAANNTFRPGEELRSYRRVRAHLRRLNKPAVKTIQALVSEPSCFLLCGIRVLSVLPVEQSPDGDTIDCVLSHLQPAFDHPGLKGMKPLVIERKLLTAALHGGGGGGGRRKGCGTVPIRRTKEEDILRASSVKRFGRKLAVRSRHDSETGGHEVTSPSEFSLSQVWVISGSFGTDLNTIEAGWQDPNHGNWWLELGSGELVGYWPSFLFSHLSEHASMVQFGGEIVNTQPQGLHTATQMGSGHYAREGFGRASYFRNLQVVDWDNSLIPVANLRVLADRPSCYDIQGGINTVWGNYFYYGGPGRNDDRCN
ncbi:hypothetical protein B296_00017148, partial [Ensete ventricosum]